MPVGGDLSTAWERGSAPIFLACMYQSLCTRPGLASRPKSAALARLARPGLCLGLYPPSCNTGGNSPERYPNPIRWTGETRVRGTLRFQRLRRCMVGEGSSPFPCPFEEGDRCRNHRAGWDLSPFHVWTSQGGGLASWRPYRRAHPGQSAPVSIPAGWPYLDARGERAQALPSRI